MIEATKAFLERYQVGALLGTGAFSEVREATDLTSGRKVAIKIIDKELSAEEDISIDSEIDILKRVQHDHIISLFDVHEGTDKIYLVMELVTGGELFDRIVDRGHFTETDAAKIVHKIVEAVDYLHDNGIAHRDLKPENLLLSDESENARVMISDFGLSKLISEEEIMKTACGTPGYVAPEVLNYDGYGKEVDLWSIGVISYVLLCGYAPFFGEKDADLFAAIINGVYEFDSPYWDDISDQAKDFIRCLLTVDSKKRMSTKEALKHAWLRPYERAPSSKNLQPFIQTALYRSSSSRRDPKSNLEMAKKVRKSIRDKERGYKPEEITEEEPEADKVKKAGKKAAGKKKEKKEKSDSKSEDSDLPNVSDMSLESTGVKSSSEELTPENVKQGKTIKCLSYNIFMRPPLIKTNQSDYKDLRLNTFVEKHLGRYDIIGLQEMYEYGSSRQEKFLQEAKKAGFVFSVKTPKYSILQGKIDGGLVLVSRYPIVKSEDMKFERGIFGDRLSAKGAIYAKIQVAPGRFANIFMANTQSSHVNDVDNMCEQVRLRQLVALKAFIVKYSQDCRGNEPIILMGDLNVNARQSTPNGGDSDEYLDMMEILKGSDGSLPMKWDDVLRVDGEHPVTFGDVLPGTDTPSETVLTHKSQQGSRARYDYLFYSKATNPKGVPVIMDKSSCTVEKFLEKNEKITQLSDHYGIFFTLFVPNTSKH